MIYTSYFFIILIISFLFFKNYYFLSKKFSLFDTQKNTVNKANIPTGSGSLFVFSLFFGLFFFNEFGLLGTLPNRFYIFLLCALALSIMSFYDDIKFIHPLIKLAIQFTLVYLSLACLNLTNFDLPLKLTILFFLYFWVYFINTINFIDGLDGFLGVYSLFFFLNILIINNIIVIETFSYYLALILLPPVFVFLLFNKPVAKLFMGDTGSIFLGFIFGFSILELIIKGYYLLAASLSAYPLLDCTITMVKKTLNGDLPWARKFDYFFLKPVIKFGYSHKYVFRIFLIFNIINTIIITISLILSNFNVLFINFIFCFCILLVFNSRKLFFSKYLNR